MKITQALVGPSIKFFKPKFLSRWGLVDYYDVNKPCVFFEGWAQSEVIQRHNSYKIVIPASPKDFPDFNVVTNRKKLFIVSSSRQPAEGSCPIGGPTPIIPDDVGVKDVTMELKDYSLFKPNVLGDKIYIYSGFTNGWSLNDFIPHNGVHLGSDKVIDLQARIDFEIITTSHQHLGDYHDINFLKENFYDKCFLNLNLSKGHGMTTVREMGLMGRMTIMNKDHYDYPSVLNYSSEEEIIYLINQESKKIGTVQPSMDCHNVGDEWLDTDFWEGE
jgi:hypothetical protein